MAHLKKTYFAIFFLLFSFSIAYTQPAEHEHPEVIHAEPIDVVGEHNSGNHAEPSGHDKSTGQGSGSSALSSSNSNTVSVTFRGKQFNISKDAKERFKDFLEESHETLAVGGWLLTLNSFFSIFDLFTSIPSGVNIDADETAQVLSAPLTWNSAMRGKMKNAVKSEIYDCYGGGIKRRDEARLWQRLYEVIDQPEKYQKENLEFDASKKSIETKLKPDLAMATQKGFDYKLTPKDSLGILYFGIGLLLDKKAGDYMAYADFLLNSRLPGFRISSISMQDKMLINKAMLHATPEFKNTLLETIHYNIGNTNCTTAFWKELKTYLFAEHWSNGMAQDGDLIKY